MVWGCFGYIDHQFDLFVDALILLKIIDNHHPLFTKKAFIYDYLHVVEDIESGDGSFDDERAAFDYIKNVDLNLPTEINIQYDDDPDVDYELINDWISTFNEEIHHMNKTIAKGQYSGIDLIHQLCVFSDKIINNN
jgi:hypothetical protein